MYGTIRIGPCRPWDGIVLEAVWDSAEAGFLAI
jgi:hypothetical protein